MYDFTKKTALVTGASRGLGRAIATLLAQGDASVAMNYAGNEVAAQEALKQVEKAGKGRVVLMKFDVSEPSACDQAVETVIKEFGGLDILVNNAGIAVDQLVMRVKDDDWTRQINVNLRGAFNLIRAVSRPMMKARQGSIVNLSSVVGETGNAGQAVYSATKAALLGLTKSVARELASRNIRVNAVAPGFIDTDMTTALPEIVKAKALEGIPLGRLGTAEEVAECVAWLCSERSSYITGQVLRVNGGMYM